MVRQARRRIPAAFDVANLNRKGTMKYCTYKDKAGEWRWRLKAEKGEILADSGEGYKNKKDCLDAINLVKGSKDAKVEDC
jgi:uncharacterized protein YegP (UPF0339 family)